MINKRGYTEKYQGLKVRLRKYYIAVITLKIKQA
jgi:hypothetical protein